MLVNSAGISQDKTLFRTDEGKMQDILQTNLMGTMLGCRAIAPAMIKTHLKKVSLGDSACIINVSSLLATRRGRGATVYAASKAGVLGFTRAFASELGGVTKRVRVNAIVPGYIETPMLDSK